MNTLGTCATAASLTIFVGMLLQVLRNERLRSADGIHPVLVCTVGATYALWAAYGWAKWDWFLIIAQTPGTVLSAILVSQLVRFRKTKRKETLPNGSSP